MRNSVVLLALACAGHAPPSPTPPRAVLTPPSDIEVIVLGTAQDGGLPHVGCHASPCERARRDAAFARMVSSLGIVDRIAQKRFLVEATPNLSAQLDRLDAAFPRFPSSEARPNPVDGVLLTHAHIGHYTGLVHFGREVASTKALPLYGTERMITFLQGAGPWSQLFVLHQVEPVKLVPETALDLTAHVRVVAVTVPHRDEFSDTIALRFEGPKHSLLFLPDIDRWDKWEKKIEDVVQGVDIALLDATFYSETELPGRSASEVPHPLVTDTVARLRTIAASGHRVILIHMNHTNPLVDPESPESKTVRAAGIEIATEGLRIAL